MDYLEALAPGIKKICMDHGATSVIVSEDPVRRRLCVSIDDRVVVYVERQWIEDDQWGMIEPALVKGCKASRSENPTKPPTSLEDVVAEEVRKLSGQPLVE